MTRRFMPALVIALIATFVMVSSVAAQELVVTAPANGDTIDRTDVVVRFEASGFSIVPSTIPLAEAGQHPEVNRPAEGHVHLMLDLGPVVVWNVADPYTFSNVPPGEHQLMVELVNNDHSSFSPAVLQEIQFRSMASQILPRTGEARSNDGSLARLALIAFGGVAAVLAGVVIRRRFA
jgi:hypothetical protein